MAGLYEPIGRDEAHLWFVWPDSITDDGLLREYRCLLSEEERGNEARFAFARDRHLYLVSRALVRTVLSRYTNIPARELTFARNRYGRPELCLPPSYAPLRFNLTHTHGLAACVVAVDMQIGVDVEDAARRVSPMSLAARCLAPAEIEDLRSLADPDRGRRFFEYWTLKESYIKARGLGFSLPLKQFSFDLKNGAIGASFDAALADDPAEWQFGLYEPRPGYIVATSIRRSQGGHVGVHQRRTTPLVT
jgi:4'-phosphopantetheinyl transferase